MERVNGLFHKLDAHHTPKEDMRIQKFYPHFSLGIPQKLITFLVERVKKTWEFPKILIIFGSK